MKQIVFLMVLTLGMFCTCVRAQKKELKIEDNGYKWYSVKSNDLKAGAEDVNGNIKER